MQVPEHLVSLYVATCGQNGPGLGSDEKEIILLVYVILEAVSGKIVGTKQLLVRPDGSFVKDRTVSTSSDNSTYNAATSPPLALSHADAINNNNTNTSNSNVIASAMNSNISSSNTNNTTNNNCNNSINNGTSSSSSSISNGPACNLVIANSNSSTLITAPTATATTTDSIELPIAVAQAAGKPLSDALEEFDEYIRSLSLSIDEGDIKIITDGQLPLRQCLHREACAKGIELPAYYNHFCDLRKEFLKYKSGDLARALVPVKDVKKMLEIPPMPAPQSIAEMLKELNIPSTEETEYYIKESRDMVSVIQTLLKAGHKFIANEIVSLVLEPGICSIDDEIDGNCIVRARGLPWQSSDQDIAKFFRGLNVAKGGVALCLSPLGRRNGEALIRFVSQEHRDMALKRHKHHIGSRYIEVYRATGEDFLAIAGGASNEAQAFLSKGAQVIIRMRGLPYDCTGKQVLDFFTTGDDPCNVLDGTEGVLFVKKPDGRATGDAFVLFANEADAPKALSRHRESIGQRYIELFRSTTAEVQQVLNRSMDPKTYESNHQPPLIAQLPAMPLSLLPQHLITSGTTKNCIRLRGLPYEALVEHILHFLDDFAKHIIYQGVHMVINAQGQPSGEAFIQMDTEESARLCALRKHNQFMMFGKKYRYIEVFQCSGDDMNMVLNGGLQSPVSAAAHHPHHSAGKQPSLLSPGASVLGTPFGPYGPFGPPTTILTSPHHRAHHPHAAHHPHHPHHPAAFYPPQFLFWSYPSPPVSPTTYFSQSAHSPTHVAGNIPAQHQAMYSLDFLPTTYPAQPAALSPPSVAIPPANGGTSGGSGGLILSPTKTQTITFVPPKHYSPLPAPVAAIQTTPNATAPPPPPSTTATPSTAAQAPNYQNKLPLHTNNNTQNSIQQQSQQQQQSQPPLNNHIHHYSSGAAAVPGALLPLPSAAANPGGTVTPLMVDTTHGERANLKSPAGKMATTNNANYAANMNGVSGGSTGAGQSSVLVTNPCVELYIA